MRFFPGFFALLRPSEQGHRVGKDLAHPLQPGLNQLRSACFSQRPVRPRKGEAATVPKPCRPCVLSPVAEGIEMGLILLIILLLILLVRLLGGLPTWGYSRSWGYGPSGVLGLLLIILLVLMILQVGPFTFHTSW